MDTLSEQWDRDLNEERQRYVYHLRIPTASTVDVSQSSAGSNNSILFLHRNAELSRILQRVVEIGMRGGWAEFEGTPLQIPRIQLAGPPSDEHPPKTIDANTDTDTNIRTSSNS